MAEKIKRGLYKLRECLCEVFLGKETLRHDTVLKSSFKPKTMKERRKESLDYLVKEYWESKKRQEEYIRKLESYGRVRRWFYERSKNLKDAGMILKEAVVKPAIMLMTIGSGAFFYFLGITIAPQTNRFIERYVPPPFSYVPAFLILGSISFSPAILSIILSYYVEKEKLERRLRDFI